MKTLRSNVYAPPSSAEAKPFFRGWLHAIAVIGAIATTCALLAQTTGDWPRFVSLLVFGLSMTMLYAVSAIYHLGAWYGRWYTVLRSFDHANIFLFIAGTYTPICVVLLSGWARTGMLGTIWALASIGVACSFLTLHMPRWILASLYVGMGWLSIILLPLMTQAISLQPVVLLAVGGALYTVGAIVYALRWPNPFPRVFGFHEIFHALVVAGTIATAAVIWIWIVPFTGG